MSLSTPKIVNISHSNDPILTRYVAYGVKSCLQFDINIYMIADYHHYVIDNIKKPLKFK
jgi:hypothetical protein